MTATRRGRGGPHGRVRAARGGRRGRHDPARPAEDERPQRRRCRRRSGPRRTRRPSATTSGRSSSTAASGSSRPAPTSRRWPTCPTPTWSSAPAALQSAFTAVARIPKPVVAAVTGYALGGGCELALCADVRFAAEDAVLGQPEILLGIIPGAGGTQRLTRLVGPSRAKDLIFTGRFVKADEALAIGLVDRVVPADRGLRRGGRLGRAVRRRRGVRPARGQGGHRPRSRGRPRDRPGDRAPAVRRPVRHRGPHHRDGVVRRERPRQGPVRGPLTRRPGRHGTAQRATKTGQGDREPALDRRREGPHPGRPGGLAASSCCAALLLAVGRAPDRRSTPTQDNSAGRSFVLDGADAHRPRRLLPQQRHQGRSTGDNAGDQERAGQLGARARSPSSVVGSTGSPERVDPARDRPPRCEGLHRVRVPSPFPASNLAALTSSTRNRLESQEGPLDGHTP